MTRQQNQPATPLPPSPEAPSRRVDLATVAAAVVLMAVLAAGAWLAAGGVSPGNVSQGLAWRYEEVQNDATDVAAYPLAAVPAGSGYVGLCAVADDPGLNGYCTSKDGLGWSIESPAWLPATVDLSSIAKGQDGYVLVGSSGSGGLMPAAFFSADGQTWQVASVPGGGSVPMVQVAAGPGGFLAIGWQTEEHSDESDASAPPIMTLWRSTDGRSWAVEAAPAGSQGVLFSTGSAYLLAPSDQLVDVLQMPLWRSEDGHSWTGPSSSDLTVAVVDDVVRLGDGSLLASVRLDRDTTESPSLQRLLRSRDDGRTWTHFATRADTDLTSLGHGVPATLVRCGSTLLGLNFGYEIDSQTVSVSIDGGASWAPLVDAVDIGGGSGAGDYDAPVQLGDSVLVAETFSEVNGSRTVIWVGRPAPGGPDWLPGVLTVLVAVAAAAALGYLLWRWRPSQIGRGAL